MHNILFPMKKIFVNFSILINHKIVYKAIIFIKYELMFQFIKYVLNTNIHPYYEHISRRINKKRMHMVKKQKQEKTLVE
uniref:Uncharacterized protein n=1 Tax=Heterorhabditis bacteriophora TaxID=37862 RepID=A0A1I7X018_HETBA